MKFKCRSFRYLNIKLFDLILDRINRTTEVKATLVFFCVIK